MYRSLAVLTLAAYAVAAPFPTQPEGKGQDHSASDTQTNYESTFDDIDPGLVGSLADTREIGPYNGLDYEGINVISLGVGGTVVTGITPRSPPNVAVYTARNTLLEGQPHITTQYPGSVTDTFDFHSFYFGCVAATAETATSLPVQCTVTAIGSKASVEVARQDFDFNPGLLSLTAGMIKAELGTDFEGVDSVTFESEYSVSALGATLLDNLKYTTYNAEDKGESNEE